MTDKILEAVARSMHQKGVNDPNWQAWIPMAKRAITAHLKALEKEGKRVMSERDIQELTTSRKVYKG